MICSVLSWTQHSTPLCLSDCHKFNMSASSAAYKKMLTNNSFYATSAAVSVVSHQVHAS